jgi:hypothetical protein
MLQRWKARSTSRLELSVFCAERDKLSSARPFHHCVERKKRRPDAHDFGDRLAVTNELEDLRVISATASG